MFRVICALIVVAAFASIGSAQPLSPGLTPGPGISIPVRSQPVPSPQTGILYFPVAMSEGWGVAWGYQSYSPWNNYSYTYEGIVGATDPAATPVELARRTIPTPVLVNEFPAKLTLQFPARAEVWLDGKKVGGIAKDEQVLTSPVLKPTQTHTFLVKARWEKGGKTYEAKREVTLGAGEHSRLLIVSGNEVRE